MKKFLKSSCCLYALTSCVLFSNSAFAVSLNVASHLDLASGGDYSSNTNGITSYSKDGTNPWKVETGGDITLYSNQFNILVSSNAGLSIVGKNGSENIFITNANGNNGIVGTEINTGGVLNLENINFIYSGNKINTIGSGSLANVGLKNTGGELNVIGNTNGSNLVKISDNLSLSHQIIGIVNYAANSDTLIKNVNIEMENNVTKADVVGLAVLANTNMEITGVSSGSNTFKIKNNKANTGAIRGMQNAKDLTINNMSFEFTGNDAATTSYFARNNNAGSILSIIGSTNRNSLIVRNNTAVNDIVAFHSSGGSVTNVENMDIYTNGDYFSQTTTGSTLNIKNTMVNIEDNSIALVNDNGSSTVNLSQNSKIYSNNGSLVSVFGGTGAVLNLNADATYMEGKSALTATESLNFKLDNISTWLIKDSSQVSNLTNNSSIIDLRSSSSNTFNTLTVNSYVGNSGTIKLNTTLGDDTSNTDKVVVDGGTALGTTELNIIGIADGKKLTTEGIKVVDAINGATTDVTAFSLLGGVVDTSAYEYELFRGDVSGIDTESWFLRTNGKWSNFAKVIANEPVAILNITKTGMNSLNKRMGELRENNPNNSNGAWIRTYAKNLHITDGIRAKMNIYGTEAGYDKKYDFNGYKLYVGGMVGYLSIDDIKNNPINGAKDGTGEGKAPSIGAYATIVGENGWFVDGVIRNFWEDLTLTSYSAGGTPIRYTPDRVMTAYSLEVGKQYKYCIDCNSMFIIEPKVELMYAHADAESFWSTLGNHIRYGHTDSFTAKAALMLGYKKLLYNGTIVEPYVQLGLIEELHGKTNVLLDGAKMRSNMSGTSYEIGGGFNTQINKSLSLYSDIIYEGGADVKALSGNLGVRYTW